MLVGCCRQLRTKKPISFVGRQLTLLPIFVDHDKWFLGGQLRERKVKLARKILHNKALKCFVKIVRTVRKKSSPGDPASNASYLGMVLNHSNIPTYFHGVRHTPLELLDSKMRIPCFLSLTTIPTWSSLIKTYQIRTGSGTAGLWRRSGCPEKVKYLRFGSSTKKRLQSHTYSGKNEGFAVALVAAVQSRSRRYTFSEAVCSTIFQLFDRKVR